VPIYEVTTGKPGDGVQPRLINARTKTGARTFASKDSIQVVKATPLRTATLMQRGVKLEHAIEEPDGTDAS
jgi:hypothetical protein